MVEVYKFNFNNMEYIVLDKFEYNGKEYMYIVEDFNNKAKDGESLKIAADFVFKCSDGMYENVVDDNLYNELINEVNKRNLENKNRIQEFYDNQLSENNK